MDILCAHKCGSSRGRGCCGSFRSSDFLLFDLDGGAVAVGAGAVSTVEVVEGASVAMAWPTGGMMAGVEATVVWPTSGVMTGVEAAVLCSYGEGSKKVGL